MEFTYAVEGLASAPTRWTERDENIHSKFDEKLCSEWDAAMEAGIFRYKLDDLQTKIISDKYKFVLQLNTKRATERRKPEQISSIDQPFNHERFNFTKVKKHEILFEMKPVSNHVGNRLDVQQNNITAEKEHNPHLVIINISPLEYCNVLLVPHINSCFPQILNQISIKLALEMMLLSSKKSLRLAWNSLCAFASVNHLHFHAYYLERNLYTEITECQQVEGTLFETTDWPVRSFVLQLNGSDLQSLTKDIYKVTSYLHANNTAHNVFLTRGDCLERRPDGRTIRVYIYPRQSFYGAKTFMAFNPAVCELSGHILVKCEEDYNKLTEETVIEILKQVALPDKQFEDIKTHIQDLFK
ncbi:GDP-D-glucose phosphorylase 1-like [Antedon mediterranea]|uniref:GDP-D-glucose phosphorylase 1-like n=1 Tax=Antedon mediterranea TaxID=105859 RepID=UPI003AF99D1C